jgi:hypothetical protein
VSYVSPPSNTASKDLVEDEGIANFDVLGIPTSPDVNGVACIARLVYITNVGWAQAAGFGVLLGNTATELLGFYGPERTELNAIGATTLVGLPNKPFFPGSENVSIEADPIPIWPNPDGPSLEDADAPEDLDDLNMTLLRDVPISVTWDLSQVRNRVFVKGRGSVSAADVSIGTTSLLVADGNAFSLNGGVVLVGDEQTLRYRTVSGEEGTFFLTLIDPVKASILSGDTVVNFYQGDDELSQSRLGKIELDSTGRVTDGVHEYTVRDQSLKSSFQLYMRAFAELEVFANPIVNVVYSTRDPLTRSGKIVHIALTNPPINGDFLIQDVTIDQIHDEGDQLLPRYTATASSVRFELNDLLLRILDQQHAFSSGGSAIGIGQTAVDQAVSSVTAGTTTVEKTQLILTTSDIDNLNTTPVEIVPAPGVGFTIWPIGMFVQVDRNAIAWSASPTLSVFHDTGVVALCSFVSTGLTGGTPGTINSYTDAGSITFGVSGFKPTNKSLVMKFEVNTNPGVGSEATMTITLLWFKSVGG